jgi:phosphatidylserine/phosphatidylglycerophosphate/cardiolipin synthase-like enzyme
MIKGQPLVLPLITLGARVTLSTPEMSIIEQTALRGIGLGLDTVDLLDDLLGLGRRPLLDLLHGLWRRGHVHLRLGSGKISLSARAAAHHRAGTLSELEPGEREERVVVLCQELLSGRVLPKVGRSRPDGADSSLLPTNLDTADLSLISQTDLLSMLNRELERERLRQPTSSLVRLTEVKQAWLDPERLLSLESAQAPEVGLRRYLTLLADIWLDRDSGRMQFSLVADSSLPSTVQVALQRALEQDAARNPELLTYKRLRQELERQSSGGQPTPDHVRAARTLLERARRLGSVDRGTFPGRHRDLLDLYADACDEVSASARAQARCEGVSGYTNHHQLLIEMAGRACRQLILCNPWVSLDGLLSGSNEGSSWYDIIARALERGVTVVLLWGIGARDTLSDEVRRSLYALATMKPGHLMWSVHPARVHAKFLVVDAEEALITSYNFLQPPRLGDSLELGLYLRGQTDKACPQALVDLLNWTVATFPEADKRGAIRAFPEDLGVAPTPDWPLPRPPHLPTLSEEPDDQRDRQLLNAWAQDWLEVASRLAEDDQRLGRGVELVVDAAHKTALWEALRGTRRRLAITSDQLSVDVVDDRFTRALGTLLEGGVSASLAFRREGASDQAEGPAARVEQLARQQAHRLRLGKARSHAKVLVSDDTLLVSSYNFLSFDGEGIRSGAGRAELGLRITDAGATERLLGTLEAAMPGLFAPLRGLSLGISALPVARPPTEHLELQEALNAGGNALVAALERRGRPLADLEVLLSSSLSQADRERARAAAWIAQGGSDTNIAAALAEERWSQGDLIGAALLLPSSPSNVTRLTSEFVAFAARVEMKQPISHLPNPTDEGLSCAVLALALVAVLRDGQMGLADTIVRWASPLPRPMAAWPAAIRQFVQSTQRRPLDWSLVASSAERAQSGAAVQQAYAELVRAVAHVRQIGFTFPIGALTWRRLEAEGGLIARLAGIHPDAPLASFAWLEGLTKGQVEIQMDEASAAVKDSHNVRIEDPKRSACVQRLWTAVQAAQQWHARRSSSAPSSSEARMLGAAQTLAGQLATLRDLNAGNADPLAAGALHVARQALAPLLLLDAK